MIPKIIHYVWLGKGLKNDLIIDCINSWKTVLPDYQIKEWNEDDFDINSHPYIKKAYDEKKFAFASDLLRLIVLKKEGGIYLDTDMFVLKKFDDFLNNDLILGKQDDNDIAAGFIAVSSVDNDFINKVIKEYDNIEKYITIPEIITKVYNNLSNKSDIKVFDSEYFYPHRFSNINNTIDKNISTKSYAIHMWNFSWENKYIKFLKKIHVYRFIIFVLNKFKIKDRVWNYYFNR